MRPLVALLLCLCALPASAQGLRGQWDVESANKQATATILIDAESRATWDVKDHLGRAGTLFGYVARNQGGDVVIPFTDRLYVVRLHCTIQSKDLLHCYAHFLKDDKALDGWVLRRVGPGPARITTRFP